MKMKKSWYDMQYFGLFFYRRQKSSRFDFRVFDFTRIGGTSSRQTQITSHSRRVNNNIIILLILIVHFQDDTLSSKGMNLAMILSVYKRQIFTT